MIRLKPIGTDLLKEQFPSTVKARTNAKFMEIVDGESFPSVLRLGNCFIKKSEEPRIENHRE